MSTGEREKLSSVLFVAPHAADDPVDEVTPVGSACFASCLALDDLLVEELLGGMPVAVLGDRDGPPPLYHKRHRTEYHRVHGWELWSSGSCGLDEFKLHFIQSDNQLGKSIQQICLPPRLQ